MTDRTPDTESGIESRTVNETINGLRNADLSSILKAESDDIGKLHANKRRRLDGPSKTEDCTPSNQRASDSSQTAFDTSIKGPLELSHPITRSTLSLLAFERHLETKPSPRPHVILGALNHWPALEVDNLDDSGDHVDAENDGNNTDNREDRAWRHPAYLLRRTLGGRRLVPVELGRSYTDDGWGQAIVPFAEFLDKYVLHPCISNDENGNGGIAYLAQHDLFAQVPALRRDISVPDYCYTSPPPPAPGTPLHAKEPRAPTLEEPLLNAWLGPAGTISPLHTDPYHNILCQVVGKKYVRLHPPEETAKLYPRGIERDGIDMSNTSSVPVEMVEMNLEIEGDDDNSEDDDHTCDGEGGIDGVEAGEKRQFPLFSQAQFVETVLSEGECLYIPVGWWHYVRSLTVSFSVSFWWN